MSTVSLSYPDVIRVRWVPAIGKILILCSFVLIGITILVLVTSAQTDLTNRAAVRKTSVAPIPVPTPLNADIQPVPSSTPSPASVLTGKPSIVPVPVPTPPSK